MLCAVVTGGITGYNSDPRFNVACGCTGSRTYFMAIFTLLLFFYLFNCCNQVLMLSSFIVDGIMILTGPQLLTNLLFGTQEFGTEKLRRAWTTTEANPHDMEAWSLIIRDAQNRSIESARGIFERLVTTFPTTGKFWKMYIEQEVSEERLSHFFTYFLGVVLVTCDGLFIKCVLWWCQGRYCSACYDSEFNFGVNILYVSLSNFMLNIYVFVFMCTGFFIILIISFSPPFR